MTSSRPPGGGAGSLLVVMVLLLFLLLLLHVAQVRFQAIKARAPDVAAGLPPYVKLVQGLGAQLVDALVSDRIRIDEPDFAECPDGVVDLRFLEPKSCGD